MVIAVLALGLGTNALVFGLLDAVVLQPLPVPESERLIEPWRDFGWLTKEEFLYLRENLRGAQAAGYFKWPSFAVLDGEQSTIVRGSIVTADYFDVLGVQPALGRFFAAENERPGAPAEVLISHRLWQSRFGGETSVIGRELIVDGEAATVLGVVPEGLGLPRATADMWMSFTFDTADTGDSESRYVQWIARLDEGVSAAAFDADAARQAALFAERFGHGENFAERTGGARSLHESLVGNIRPMVMALFLAAAAVLLVVTVNVANLLLARGAARRRELAVRSAIGADRLRLLRLMSTEGLLLSVTGGAIGTAIAYVGLARLPEYLPWWMRHARIIEPDQRLIFAGLGLSVMCGLLFAALPALKLLRADLATTLRSGASDGLGRSRLHGFLVVAEIALAFVLVATAGVVAASFIDLLEVEPGFDSTQVATLRPYFPGEAFDDMAAFRALHRRYEEKIAAVPGVLSVGGTHMVPMLQSGFNGGMTLEGRPTAEGEAPIVNWRVVTPGYFDSLGMQIRRGRGFTETDRSESVDVVVVNQAFVDQHLRGEPALGRRLAHSLEGSDWLEIVGIVSDIRQNNLMQAPVPEVYRPLEQVEQAVGMAMVVRVAGEPGAYLETLRRAAAEVAPEIPISDLRPMAGVVADTLLFQRLTAFVFGAFALLALALAAAGIYAVVAFETAQRVREIGLRLALGAEPGGVLRLVLSQTLRRAALGLVIGLALAAATARFTASLLHELEPLDPVVLTTALVALGGSALLAALRPALKASRLDPLVALREE